jgi:hypothetical protein
MTLEEVSTAPYNHTDNNSSDQHKSTSEKTSSQKDTSGLIKQGSTNSQNQSTITMEGLISRAGQQP